MPSPVHPQRPSNRGGAAKVSPTKTKPLDIGRPLGIYDTNSVREKVRKWQQQGGGVITANDGVYYDDEEENNSAAESKPKLANEKPSGSSNSSVITRMRSQSTPRKRVISDEHWKLNRTPTQAQAAAAKLPAPKRISEYTTNDALRSARNPGKDDDGISPPTSRSRDRDRSTDLATRERRKSRASRDVETIPEERGEENSGSHNGSSKSTSRPSSGKGHTRAKSEQPQSSKYKDLPLDDDSEWATSEADFSELSRRRARGSNPTPKAPTPKAPSPKGPGLNALKARMAAKPPKGGIFEHMLDASKEIFGKPEPPKPAPPRGAKIQAWLSNTPDPFSEGIESDVEVPAPLKMRFGNGKPTTKSEKSHGSDVEHSLDSDTPRQDAPSRRSKGDGNSPASDRAKPKEEVARGSGAHRDGSASSKKKHGESTGSRPSSRGKDLPLRERPRDMKDDVSEAGTHPLSEGSEVSGNSAPVPLGRTKPIPTTGAHPLTTIASVESMSKGANAAAASVPETQESSAKAKEDDEERDSFDPNSLPVVSSQLKRRLTTHDDLISVLSAPNSRSRSLRSARSLKTKNRVASETIPDILKELSADEAKYMRELKTLVGGVIPVLLTCVLSRSDSAIAAGLFRPSADPKDEVNFSKPIVDMGVAIERLKTLHKRIPEDNVDALLNWAHGAQRVYREYLKAWRLGFKDVIVNLAPLEEGEGAENADTKSLDEGMARDENGDVVDSDGEKVDVAYLLKRPLVRLKYLAKTFKGIKTLQPSPKAEEIASGYQTLVTEARRRAREERARLEDESAASIDATRARDPATLGALTEVTVNRSRRVRARDFFNLSLYHSSGQMIDCRAELLLRDATPQNRGEGDLLICEIDHTDRWLLFPPIALNCVSARNGDTKGEIIVMLRSAPGQEKAWQELLILQIEEEEIGNEWVQMLGLVPVPPAICRTQSFIDRAKQRKRAQTISSSTEASQVQRAPPSPTNVNIPIGEKAEIRAKRRSLTPRDQFSEPGTFGSSWANDSYTSLHSAMTRESDYATGEGENTSKASPRSQPILHAREPRKSFTGDDRPHGLKRSKAKRVSRYGESTPTEPIVDKGKAREPEEIRPVEQKKPKEQDRPQRPPMPDRRLSSVPSMDLPVIPKLRRGSSQTYITDSLASTSDDDDYSAIESAYFTETPTEQEEPPAPPPHSRSPSSTGSSLSNAPVLSPGNGRLKRRGSSPLKHEYEPSTASDSYSDSDTSTVRRYDMQSGSEYSATDSSDDETEDELASLPTRQLSKSHVQDSVMTSASTSLSLTNAASEGGYRSVPSQPAKSSAAIAAVFAWSDKGSWESIFPDECKVIVSPGLIEAYNMSDAPMGMEDEATLKKLRPLVALELTPLVPIRRGTAIDISIRSPPTKRSKINWSNNIMFRSRNADECEVLYGLINHARINNPTYIALQNARGPYADQALPEEAPSRSGGLFGWPRRRRSYRAATTSPRSQADNSDSSVGTVSSAFSALKRFGAGSKMFNISRSSLTSRNGHGQKEDSLYSDSLGSHASPSSGIGRIAAAIKGVDGIGLSNAKIRLYMRETQSKWRDMGAARLTIMPAPHTEPREAGRSDSTTFSEGMDGSPPSSGAASPRRPMESEKRILIRGKTRGEVLLDVCLGESCFERVARTGIAVSVWEETEGGAMPKKGGVMVGFSRIYMIQMKSEAEAAYTFGLVGKSKY
ncbi:uncharacterized protein BP01DRAFT_40084 [Aspergillus saccharolyticus JOP 1030-1]|uniref:SRm160/300 splicing coactivator n=1 Tax=Aspergillus saccharolyticus JOP 1030-1 TaxID=1450539 RepID=A0A319AGK6_9EURO|nr:hypothetical protein BP01DRAFT_40084 [Aspergillus saccharolyticus JOP 1030-1]PYH45812.1 hypothetical protein BP01DRAFT_40084 [Aspergillus saccharolyticus JOP 1030-1]